MARALIEGLLAAKVFPPERIVVAEPVAGRREVLKRDLGVGVTGDNREAVGQAEVVVIAVKPQAAAEVFGAIPSSDWNGRLIVSIMAGVSTSSLERMAGGAPAVVRVMPNTPALVGAGVSAACPGRYAGAEDMALAREILSPSGRVVELEEGYMDAVTAVSGSGPAYLFAFTEALTAAAERIGLPEETARELAVGTVAGAARLLEKSAAGAARLREMVTSPGGTTEAALAVLNRRGFEAVIAEAVRAARDRSRELGEKE